MPNDRVIRFLGQEIALGGFALLLMLIAILAPTVTYSINLREPTPAQLLIAICIGMFASVLYLWVLDASSTIQFRSVWVSRAIYGAAIASILGTSVGVYKDAFVQDPFPFQGEWLMTVNGPTGSTLVARRPVSLAYSRATSVYWGYGAAPTSAKADPDVKWVEVTALYPTKRHLEFRLSDLSGLDQIIAVPITETRAGSSFSSTAGSSGKYVVQLSRRN